jgi:hypothetical protein
MPRLYFSFFIAFLALLAGCGLSERERAVSRVNAHIRAVEAAGQRVADAIGELPDRDLATGDFEALRGALRAYLDDMDGLNGSMRELGEHLPELDEHVQTTFRPAAEAAASSCQLALDAFDDEPATQEDYQRAITRVGQCLERYATAVSNVKAAHDRSTH